LNSYRSYGNNGADKTCRAGPLTSNDGVFGKSDMLHGGIVPRFKHNVLHMVHSSGAPNDMCFSIQARLSNMPTLCCRRYKQSQGSFTRGRESRSNDLYVRAALLHRTRCSVMNTLGPVNIQTFASDFWGKEKTNMGLRTQERSQAREYPRVHWMASDIMHEITKKSTFCHRIVQYICITSVMKTFELRI
jgi:hypothetical protein